MRRILALAFVALAVTAGCGDDDAETDAVSTTSTTEVTTTITDTPPQPTTTAPPSARLVDPAETARAWIQAIADGDDDRAIALTSPRSLAAFGGAEGFTRDEIALSEGWGAWGRAEETTVSVVDLQGLDGVALVVLHGEVSQEGPPEESWAAMPVVATADGDRVEPFLDLGDVEVMPEDGAVIAPDQDFTSVTPAGSDVYFAIDGGELITPSLDTVDSERITSSFSGAALAPGLHALTVVISNEEGIMARTFTYHVSQ